MGSLYSSKGNDYYSVLSTPGPTLTAPRNVFALEQNLMKNVVDFETRYARYLRCGDPNVSSNVTNPVCDLNTTDSYASLTNSYDNVMISINDLNSALNNISNSPSGAITNNMHDDIKANITGVTDKTVNMYDQIIALRAKLDSKLDQLYNEQKAGPESSAMKLDAARYANTLWIILASCLLYYVIVEL
jgi:hypothetical protein